MKRNPPKETKSKKLPAPKLADVVVEIERLITNVSHLTSALK